MKYSEVKTIIKEARDLGLERDRHSGIWSRLFYLPHTYKYRFHISDALIIGSRVPLRYILESEYQERADEAIKAGPIRI